MTQIYQDIISLVKVDIAEEDQQAVDQYCKKLAVWKCVLVIALIIVSVVAFYGVFMEFPWAYSGFLVYVALYILRLHFIKKQSEKFTDLMHEECDADRMLSCFMALAAETKREKRWEDHLSTIALTLFYSGRFSDCQKLLPLFQKYCDNDKGAIRYTVISMCLCYQEKNAEALQEHAKALEQLMSKAKNDYVMRSLCERAMRYPALLELTSKGQYDAVCGLLQQANGKVTQLVNVSKQYRLYHAASHAGMTEVAQKHKAFVLEHGGTTFYKKELERLGE